MKLRIKGDTIRLRLTQPEVLHVRDEGSLYEQTNFSVSQFKYGIIKGTGEDIRAFFEDKTVTIRIPEELIAEWANDDSKVGISGNMRLLDGGELKISVEKDFKCLTERTNEDESNNYPNPLENHNC